MQKALTQEEIKDWSIDEIDEKWPEIMLSSDYYKEGHASVKLTLSTSMDLTWKTKADAKCGFIATRESIIEDLFDDLFLGLSEDARNEVKSWLWADHNDMAPDLSDKERKTCESNNLPFQIELTMPEVKS
jgi:hypothetical protein